MELSSWLKKDIEDLPLLGKETFNTFLQICSEFSKWALDDITLSTRNDKYKVWSCRVKSTDIKKVKGILERYNSMRKLLHYYNNNIVNNKPITFYMCLNYIGGWKFEYGVSNGDELYKIGEFDYNIKTKLPSNEIVKYVSNQLTDFNEREHLLLYNIRKDMREFDPGYCQITEPIIIDNTVMVSTHNLGQWNDDNTLSLYEKDNMLETFKDWATNKPWASAIKLIVRPKIKKQVDFIIKLK